MLFSSTSFPTCFLLVSFEQTLDNISSSVAREGNSSLKSTIILSNTILTLLIRSGYSSNNRTAIHLSVSTVLSLVSLLILLRPEKCVKNEKSGFCLHRLQFSTNDFSVVCFFVSIFRSS